MPISLDEALELVFHRLQIIVQGTNVNAIDLVAFERSLRDGAEHRGLTLHWSGADILLGEDSINVRAALSELGTAGLIVWGASALQPTLPHFQITAFGRECLQEGRISLHDGGYVRALVARVPSLSSTARAFMEESIQAFRASCYRAADVMLGCASESVMVDLIQAFHDALPAGRRQNFERDAIRPLSIARRFGAFRQRLIAARNHLPPDLDEDLELRLDAIFALIRKARNDSGHPNIRTTSRATAHGNLLLFPSYCERAYGLMAYFGANPVP